MYCYEKSDWTSFRWQTDEVLPLLTHVHQLQGDLLGRMQSIGFALQQEAHFATLVQDTLKTSQIEGEVLSQVQVRSSLAQKLGLSIAGLGVTDRAVDGLVEMLLDATQYFNTPLSEETLFSWHGALFPMGRSGLYKIEAAQYRSDHKGRMQVVSGEAHREIIHFEAPSASVLNKEMEAFIHWYNASEEIDMVIKAAIAHFWFITLHPFEDGNGRMARALTDRLLAKWDNTSLRFYSMSAQIQKERNAYYQILEETQKGNVDITNWIKWFLNTLQNAFKNADEMLLHVFKKHQFWQNAQQFPLNDRQIKTLNRLLADFEGNLNVSKWAKLNKCSTDTALRDLQDLTEKGLLQKSESGGRSTHYILSK